MFNAFPLNLTSIQKPHRIPTGPWGYITVPIPMPTGIPMGIPIPTAALLYLHAIPERLRDEFQIKRYTTSGYATWFAAGGAIRIAHYDVIADVITRKL